MLLGSELSGNPYRNKKGEEILEIVTSQITPRAFFFPTYTY